MENRVVGGYGPLPGPSFQVCKIFGAAMVERPQKKYVCTFWGRNFFTPLEDPGIFRQTRKTRILYYIPIYTCSHVVDYIVTFCIICFHLYLIAFALCRRCRCVCVDYIYNNKNNNNDIFNKNNK